MVRTTDQEMIATGKTVYELLFPRMGGMPHHTGPPREAPRSVRRQKK